MKIVMKLQNSVLLVLLIFSLPKTAFAFEQQYNHVGFYIENFGGRVDPDTLPHVYDVFKKIRAIFLLDDSFLNYTLLLNNL